MRLSQKKKKKKLLLGNLNRISSLEGYDDELDARLLTWRWSLSFFSEVFCVQVELCSKVNPAVSL